MRARGQTRVGPVSACPVTVGPVTVPPVRSNLRGVLYPTGVWVLLKGGRAICRSFQRCGRLTGVLVPLPLEDAVALQHWKIR